MPYFRWNGVNMYAKKISGYMVAGSKEEIDSRLFSQGIALLSAKKTFSFHSKKCNLKQKYTIFRHIARLQKAGILLPNAIELVANRISNPYIQDILYSVAKEVIAGDSFAKAIAQHPQLSSELINHILSAGQKSGDLTLACNNIANYLQMKHTLQKNIAATMAMPIITLGCFSIITVVMFIFVVPQIANMLSTFNQSIPPTTAWLLWFAESLSLKNLFITSFGAICTVFAIKKFNFTHRLKDVIILHVPIIKTIFIYIHTGQALQTLSVLLESGTPLVSAGSVITNFCTNEKIQVEWKNTFKAIKAGESFSSAIMQHAYIPYKNDLSAQLAVGQSSGNLIDVCKIAAEEYFEYANIYLQKIVNLIQPFCIIILGFLIVGLMISLYAPIMQTSFLL